MPYKSPLDKKTHNQRYYKNWYKKNGRDRAIDYLEATIEWQKRNPEKRSAHGKVKYALSIGKLVKPENCSQCNRNTRLVAHHKDYTKPLVVVWLCSSCHKLLHLAS